MAISKEDNQDISRKLGKPVANAVKTAALDNAKVMGYRAGSSSADAKEYHKRKGLNKYSELKAEGRDTGPSKSLRRNLDKLDKKTMSSDPKWQWANKYMNTSQKDKRRADRGTV
jgi:hypothetical protein